jgi:hypothetical protein
MSSLVRVEVLSGVVGSTQYISGNIPFTFSLVIGLHT